ncbi:hypothetical protein LZ554_008225 [Drepanopeziza brunnea f. sp. 'monogermtubi']|nr:hypothetical protein LZ554_008225 [Drepanopeziza brunnea f. sp. 'monogermtubi']
MMFINAVAVAITLIAPAAARALQFEPGTEPFLQVCRDSNLVDCTRATYEFGLCSEIPSEYVNKVTSINTFGANCRFYVSAGCPESAKSFTAYGTINDLSQGDNAEYDNAAVSFLC